MGIRLGIIGAGGIGQVHAKAAVAAGQTVVAVADVNREAAGRLAAMLDEMQPQERLAHGCLIHDSASLLLADDSIDAAIVCVPNRWHRELAIEAMQAGKDVLLEL